MIYHMDGPEDQWTEDIQGEEDIDLLDSEFFGNEGEFDDGEMEFEYDASHEELVGELA